MRRVEIRTVYGDHLIFNDVVLAGPSDGEKFFCVRRDDMIDYFPAYDIKRATVYDNTKKTVVPVRKGKQFRGQNKRVNERN